MLRSKICAREQTFALAIAAFAAVPRRTILQEGRHQIQCDSVSKHKERRRHPPPLATVAIKDNARLKILRRTEAQRAAATMAQRQVAATSETTVLATIAIIVRAFVAT